MTEIERLILKNQKVIIAGLYMSSGVTYPEVVDGLKKASQETDRMLQNNAVDDKPQWAEIGIGRLQFPKGCPAINIRNYSPALHTVGQLDAMTDREILMMHQIGPVALKHIRSAIENLKRKEVA